MSHQQAHYKSTASGFSLTRYGNFHGQALQRSITQQRKTPLATLMTAAVIGIALAIPAVFFVLFNNVGSVAGSLEKNTQISLFLDKSITSAATEDLRHHIQTRPDVADVRYISPEAGLQELETQGELSDILAQLPENPLPPVIVVTPATHDTPEKIQQLFQHLQQTTGVASAKLDMQWVERLHAIVALGESTVMALSVLFALAVLLVIHHTIHLATQSHHKEMRVLLFIGATQAFIRRPFLYAGILYGLMGGIFAWLFVEIFMLWLNMPVSHLAALYHTSFALNGLGFFAGILLIVLSMLLGWLGSWLAVNSYVKQRLRF